MCLSLQSTLVLMVTSMPLHPEWLPVPQLLPPQVLGGCIYRLFSVHSIYLCPGVKFIAAILKILLLEIKYLSL